MSSPLEIALDNIATCLQVERSLISPTTVATDLPEWDSMAVVELVFMLQRDYDVTLPPAEALKLTSVEAVLAALRQAGKLT